MIISSFHEVYRVFLFVVFYIEEISDEYKYKENVKIPCTLILKA